ncbi:o-succinylbenzoate synthase [Lactococcus protaetiae]|uniref:o-succinylbenzoate synthase n=1 Tax=Lactococcus protaetiae TaxID=2592653 RepID=A0A514Z8E1_9LACT|nr:o-succinylbenzoate synthase [Lactococcus protaetiae]QDK70859.1 o-succinylbenzoate synthase [Lactococcus protaetiae]
MKINRITLSHVQLPMKFNFKTAKGEVKYRDTIILKVEDDIGLAGFGEVVSFTTPFYTSETFDASWEKLEKDYIPKLLAHSISHPFDIHQCFDNASPMAIAGLENALLDLYFKEKNENLIVGLFQEKLQEKIPRGAVLGDMPLEQLFKETDQLVQSGVGRIKVKISPKDGFERTKLLVEKFPQIRFAVDANRSFSLNDWAEIKKFDQLNLVCIEEAFDIMHLSELTEISSRLATPLCFDESVQTLSELTEIAKLPGKTMLNIKIGRLGGLYQTMKAIDFCRHRKIGFWVGSMVESGISKILHVQLAALAGNVMAGDLSDSQHYFDEDLINPEISFPNGWMLVPTGVGIGVAVNEDAFSRATIRTTEFRVPEIRKI